MYRDAANIFVGWALPTEMRPIFIEKAGNALPTRLVARRVRRAHHKSSVYGFYFGAHGAPYSEVSWFEARNSTSLVKLFAISTLNFDKDQYFLHISMLEIIG